MALPAMQFNSSPVIQERIAMTMLEPGTRIYIAYPLTAPMDEDAIDGAAGMVEVADADSRAYHVRLDAGWVVEVPESAVAAIDAAAAARVNDLFLAKLRAIQPNHPWLHALEDTP